MRKRRRFRVAHRLDRRVVGAQSQPLRDRPQPRRRVVEDILGPHAHDAATRQGRGKAQDAFVDVAPGGDAGHRFADPRMLRRGPQPMLRERGLGGHRVSREMQEAGFRIGGCKPPQRGCGGDVLGRFLHRHARCEPRHEDIEHSRARPVPALEQPRPRRGQVFGALAAERDLRQRPHQARTAVGKTALDPIGRQRRFQLGNGAVGEQFQLGQSGKLRMLADHCGNDRCVGTRRRQHEQRRELPRLTFRHGGFSLRRN